MIVECLKNAAIQMMCSVLVTCCQSCESKCLLIDKYLLIAAMAGMEMLAPGGIPVSQAPQSHLHPHTAAMMQHAAATHPGIL